MKKDKTNQKQSGFSQLNRNNLPVHNLKETHTALYNQLMSESRLDDHSMAGKKKDKKAEFVK